MLIIPKREAAENLVTWGYLDRVDGDFEKALASYQHAYRAEIGLLSLHFHRREAVADGQLGPATSSAMLARFCDVPDGPLVEGARWPDQCKDNITVSWNFERLPGASRDETRAAWDSLVQYESLFLLNFDFVPDQYPGTRIHASLKPLPGGTLAWSFLPNGRCSFRAEQAYDSTVQWTSERLRVGTIRHEVGHALGMQHSPQDPNAVMYPSMRGQFELNNTDIGQMLLLGYRRRSNPNGGPRPKVSATVMVGDQRFELFQKDDNGNGGWWP